MGRNPVFRRLAITGGREGVGIYLTLKCIIEGTSLLNGSGRVNMRREKERERKREELPERLR